MPRTVPPTPEDQDQDLAVEVAEEEVTTSHMVVVVHMVEGEATMVADTVAVDKEVMPEVDRMAEVEANQATLAAMVINKVVILDSLGLKPVE